MQSCVKLLVRLKNVHNMAYIAPPNMRKYQTNLNNMVTLRAKEELNKMESFGSQKQGAEFLLCIVILAMIAKFRYRNFVIIAKIQL